MKKKDNNNNNNDDDDDDSPSLEGKYSEHGLLARRGALSIRGMGLFVGGNVREGLVQSNVARRAEHSRFRGVDLFVVG